MQKELILKLNQLNTDFYNTIAKDFDDSRNHSWPGWEKLIEILDGTAITSCLDVGCGNGRFGTFLLKHMPSVTTYYGIDSNETLLDAAKKVLPSRSTTLEQQDVVQQLLEKKPLLEGSQKFELITLFGVMHHIPSQALRIQLLQNLTQMLAPGGILVCTTWQFMEFERYVKKQVAPSSLGIPPEELEPNDYFLDWKRGNQAIRYCHYFSESEIASLFATLPLTLVQTFRADGKEGSGNAYYVLTNTRTLS